MMFYLRCVVLSAVVLVGALAAAQTAPSTQPATRPTTVPVSKLVKLHATAISSGEIDLSWYDFDKGVDRFLIERSADGGKTWRPCGNEPGGSATAHYDHKDDRNLDPETHYFYELVKPENGEVLSEVADATTEARNLLEAVKGQSTVKLTDVTSIGFWRATFNAAGMWLVSFVPSLIGAA